MPRQITEMPKPKPRGNSKYAWDEWTVEGNRLAFVEGEDFTCKPSSFEVQVRSEAAKRDLSATVLEDEPTEDGNTVLAVEFKAPKPSTDDADAESDEDTEGDDA